MEKGDKSLVIIGVQHIATKNSVTVRARIFLSAPSGAIFCFDADSTTWDLQQINLNVNDYPEMRNILGVAS
jgi:hypothetical protein